MDNSFNAEPIIAPQDDFEEILAPLEKFNESYSNKEEILAPQDEFEKIVRTQDDFEKSFERERNSLTIISTKKALLHRARKILKYWRRTKL